MPRDEESEREEIWRDRAQQAPLFSSRFAACQNVLSAIPCFHPCNFTGTERLLQTSQQEGTHCMARVLTVVYNYHQLHAYYWIPQCPLICSWTMDLTF